MKQVVFNKDGVKHLGIWREELVEGLGVIGKDLPASSQEIIENWHRIVKNRCQGRYKIEEINLIAPVVKPEKLICVGRNYAAHAKEMGAAVSDLPVIFSKFPSALAGPNQVVPIPAVSDKVDYEAELVVVIGREAKNVQIENAFDYVFGYCCGNDVSARDWQKGRPGGQWLLGKTPDAFAPIGPFVASKESVDPSNLDIRLSVNNQVRQSANTSDLIFKIDFLISHLSKFCTLKPGDLLFTGTPAGVAAGMDPPVFLQPGDETVVEIQGLGQLKNRFVASN